MKTWNYRVMVDADGNYTIREVFYNEDKAIEGWTDECAPFGENFDQLKQDMEYMLQALSRDIIIEAHLMDDKLEEFKDELGLTIDQDSEAKAEDNKDDAD